MNLNKGIRVAHRWLSMIFTAVALANIVALVMGSQAQWLGFLALPPLLFMMLTGLYLFALPYTAKGRAQQAQAQRPAE